MKKILALVLAFCLMAAILPAAAEDAGSLLTMFGTSDGEGDAQGVAGFVTGGDSDLNPDSIGSIIQGTGENVKIYSDEGEDELPGPEKEGGGTGKVAGGEIYAGDGNDVFEEIGNMLVDTGSAGGGEIYAGDGEDLFAEIGDLLGSTGNAESVGIYAGAGKDIFAETGSTIRQSGDVGGGYILAGGSEDALGGPGDAGDALSESDSTFSGSSRGFGLDSLGSMFSGDGSGLDLGSLGSLFGGDGSGLDLGSLGGLLGGDGSGLNLGGLLGGGETAPVNTVPAENPEQFYGTWEISSLRVAGYEIGMDMLKQFGLDEPSSMTATLTADSVTFAETNGKTGTRAITAVDFSDGALTITLDSTPAKLQLTDTGNLLCTVSAAQYGIDASVDIIFTRAQ